jgi:hypothetical protein
MAIDLARAQAIPKPWGVVDLRPWNKTGSNGISMGTWCVEAERETWLLVLSGGAIAGAFDVATGDAIFAQLDRVDIRTSTIGMVVLAAYAGVGPVPHLLQRLRQPGSTDARRPQEGQPLSLTRRKAALLNIRLEKNQ